MSTPPNAARRRPDSPHQIFLSAVREPHIWTWLWSNRVAAAIVWLVAPWRLIRPNQITVLAAIVGHLAAFLVATGDDTWGARLTCIVLVELYLILDCTDGQLARYAKKTSQIGALLDSVLDRFVYVALFTAVAWRLGAGADHWWFIVAAVASASLLILHPLGSGAKAKTSPSGPSSLPRRAYDGVIRVFGTAQTFFWLSIALLAKSVSVWLAFYAVYYTLRLCVRVLVLARTPASGGGS